MAWTVTKNDDGTFELELRGTEGQPIKAAVRVDAHPDGIVAEFTFPAFGTLSALIPRPSAKLLRDALSDALDTPRPNKGWSAGQA